MNLEFELSPYAKTTLSWLLVTEMLKLSDERHDVFNLFPMGGQYDCIALVNPHGEQILVNRLGENALVRGETIGPMWARVASWPRAAAMHLWSEGRLRVGPGAEINSAALKGAALIAQFCAEDMSETAEVFMGWDEFSPDAPNKSVLDEFALPPAWREAEPPQPDTTWAAWLWVLARKGKIVAVANMQTGELVDKKGAPWRSFQNVAIVDEHGSPAVAIAYELEVRERGESHSSKMIVRPSVARGVHRNLVEDGDTVTMKPLTQLTSPFDVAEVWRSTRGDLSFLSGL
jgi:hypothetical protein